MDEVSERAWLSSSRVVVVKEPSAGSATIHSDETVMTNS
jgi:hypothetical protein